MSRLDKQREITETPKRRDFAKKILTDLGYHVTGDKAILKFQYKGNTIRLFVYSGWHTGKGIKDGRGLQNLIEQITPTY